ncbi:MAG: APC family permease [Chitinophagaceae bacterium]|nr:APC family permease [Chitinophagaceae bacterium]
MEAQPKAKPTHLLGLFDVSVLMVSFVLGMGIFRTPVNVAAAIDSPLIYFLSWVAGGVVAFCGALTYAEIGSRLPVTGGYYKVFSYAYHPSIAFGINCVIIISNAATLGAVALVGGEYITGVLFPHSDPATLLKYQTTIALVSIVLFYGINLLGLKMSARAQNVLTIIKVALVLALISPLFFETGTKVDLFAGSAHSQNFLAYLKAFGIGLVAVSFTYGGYQQTINFGEEIKHPRKTLPRAIFIGIAIILVLYLLINYAYVKVIGYEALGHSTNIAAIMASKVFGPAAEKILSVLLFLSVLAYVNVLLMSNPRVMAAMSDDKILPAAFNKRNPKTDVLTTSVSVFAAVSALIVFWAKEFDTILSFTILLDCFGMSLSAAAIFILRKRTRHLDDTGIYKIKWYPLLPLIFIAAYTFVGISIIITERKTGLTALGVLAAFLLIYFLFAGKKQQKT